MAQSTVTNNPPDKDEVFSQIRNLVPAESADKLISDLTFVLEQEYEAGYNAGYHDGCEDGKELNFMKGYDKGWREGYQKIRREELRKDIAVLMSETYLPPPIEQKKSTRELIISLVKNTPSTPQSLVKLAADMYNMNEKTCKRAIRKLLRSELLYKASDGKLYCKTH
jgi:flagellar biosynthesis/type III secretory pathway protein FliH